MYSSIEILKFLILFSVSEFNNISKNEAHQKQISSFVNQGTLDQLYSSFQGNSDHCRRIFYFRLLYMKIFPHIH